MARKTQQLMVRIDADSKGYLAKAAELRKVSVSDYIRLVTVPQARREVDQADLDTVTLAPEEQLAFWEALNDPSPLTAAQRSLGRLMRGDD